MATKKKNTKKKNTKKPAAKKPVRPFVIARCRMAGVHAGYLGAEKGGRLTRHDSRRIWYWEGAASLSEIAVYGCNPAKSANCKFSAKIATLTVLSTDVFELIYCQPAGQRMIESQPEWRAS
jgi:hypothetical protein